MTVDFRADKPTDAAPTSNAPNAAPANSAPADQQAFLEYNGRKLSAADVLTKLANADQFIETLKTERETDRKTLAELQAQVTKSLGVKEVLDAVNTQHQQAPVQKPVDEAALVERAAALIQERQAKAAAEATRTSNWKTVTTTLAAQFGDKVNEAVASAAASHGMSVEAAAELAKTAPSAFLALFPKTTPPVTLKGGRVNSQAVNAAPEGPKVAEFFKNPSIKDRVAIMQDAIKRASAQ